MSRVEINLSRLLQRCETMAAERNASEHWRLTKYLDSLIDYMSDLRKLSASGPSPEAMMEYTRRVELLKGILEAEKLSSASEKSLAIDLLVSSNQTNSLHKQTKAKYHKDIRDELLLSKKETSASDSVLTRRLGDEVARSRGATEDVDLLLKHHQEEQQRIAEDMVQLARNLKENARAAGRVVRDDKDKLVESSRLADSNFSKLKIETEKLEMHAKKNACFWTLIMIVVVIAVFIWMVIFMKMFSKK